MQSTGKFSVNERTEGDETLRAILCGFAAEVIQENGGSLSLSMGLSYNTMEVRNGLRGVIEIWHVLSGIVKLGDEPYLHLRGPSITETSCATALR